MKNKHAYLIIVHNEFEILKILLSMLDDERNDIYLHFDKKVDNIDINIEEFQLRNSKLFILDERIDVRWGDLSLVKTELLIFEAAYNNGEYAYYHLLSGVDLPIKTQDYIHQFFNDNNGFEFVGYSSYSNLNRVLKYHLFTNSYKETNKLSKAIKSLIRYVLLLIPYQRKSNMVFRRGCNWVSITSDLVSQLLEKKEFILKRFRYTCCGDEYFIQSVLWNSDLRNHIYNPDDEFAGCMRAIDWNRGDPYVWRNEDFQELKDSDKLFARKFSSKQMDIVRKIQKEYSNMVS